MSANSPSALQEVSARGWKLTFLLALWVTLLLLLLPGGAILDLKIWVASWLPYAQVLGMIGLLGWFSFWIMLRRQGGRSSPVLEHGQLLLNPATHEVMLGGAPVNLSVREFALLHAFLEQPGVPLSRAQLEERLYGWDEEIESNVVEVYIHSLRRKLGAEWIRNVRGVGYLIPERA